MIDPNDSLNLYHAMINELKFQRRIMSEILKKYDLHDKTVLVKLKSTIDYCLALELKIEELRKFLDTFIDFDNE